MYQPLGKLPDGRYTCFLYDPTPCHELWSTPEQKEYNRSTKPCPACGGFGYRIYQHNGVVVRENIGCYCCGGPGKVHVNCTRCPQGAPFPQVNAHIVKRRAA